MFFDNRLRVFHAEVSFEKRKRGRTSDENCNTSVAPGKSAVQARPGENPQPPQSAGEPEPAVRRNHVGAHWEIAVETRPAKTELALLDKRSGLVILDHIGEGQDLVVHSDVDTGSQ